NGGAVIKETREGVIGDGGVADGQRPVEEEAVAEDASAVPAEAALEVIILRGVVADGGVADAQRPVVGDAAAVVVHNIPIGDGQSRDADGRRRADVEHPRGVVAADRDDAGSWSSNSEVLADHQFAGGQRDGAGQAGLEVHRATRGGSWNWHG